MPGNNRGISSSTLIAFADDVAVVAIALLEEAINQSLDVVARWMVNIDFMLSVSKTRAIMLTTKHGYMQPNFFLEGELLQPKDHICYLGVELCIKLGFWQALGVGGGQGHENNHFAVVAYAEYRRPKAEETPAINVCRAKPAALRIWASAFVF